MASSTSTTPSSGPSGRPDRSMRFLETAFQNLLPHLSGKENLENLPHFLATIQASATANNIPPPTKDTILNVLTHIAAAAKQAWELNDKIMEQNEHIHKCETLLRRNYIRVPTEKACMCKECGDAGYDPDIDDEGAEFPGDDGQGRFMCRYCGAVGSHGWFGWEGDARGQS